MAEPIRIVSKARPRESRVVRTERLSCELRRLLRTVRHELVYGLGLREVGVPERFRLLCGHVRDEPVALRSRRYESEFYESITLAHIEDERGSLRSVTVVGVPRAEYGLPIVGFDVIAVGGSLSLVALDLAPIDDDVWARVAEGPLRRLRAPAYQGAYVERKMPEFARGRFSKDAFIVGARPGRERETIDLACAFVRDVVRVVDNEVSARAGCVDAARKRSVEWRRAELRNQKEHSALSRIFGPDEATAYLRDFLFRIPTHECD